MSKTDLEKLIVLACQDAWRQEGNTTLNKMIEWILKAVLVEVQADFENKLDDLYNQLHPPEPEPAPVETKKVGRPKNG